MVSFLNKYTLVYFGFILGYIISKYESVKKILYLKSLVFPFEDFHLKYIKSGNVFALLTSV